MVQWGTYNSPNHDFWTNFGEKLQNMAKNWRNLENSWVDELYVPTDVHILFCVCDRGGSLTLLIFFVS